MGCPQGRAPAEADEAVRRVLEPLPHLRHGHKLHVNHLQDEAAEHLVLDV